MLKWIQLFFASILGNAAARVLTGAGMAVVSFAALSPLVLGAFNLGAQNFNNMGGDILMLANRAGFGVALSMIGAAALTRIAISSATMGLKKAASGA